MSHRLIPLLIAVALLVCSRGANAGVDRWTSISSDFPDLAQSRVLIDSDNPAVLYSSAGYRSTNRGADWTKVGVSQGVVPTDLKLASPSQSGVLYGAYEGLLRSSDYGDTWTQLYSLPLFVGLYLQVVMEGGSGSHLVMVVEHLPKFSPFYMPPYSSTVLTSDDSGKTWIDASAGLPLALLNAIAIDPADTATMYASVGNMVYKTIDGGRSWVNTSSVSASVYIVDIAVQPRHSNMVYAATLPNFSVDNDPGGLYVSVDGGATWTPNQRLGNVALNSLTFDPFTPSTMYAASNGQGVFRSTDFGQSWVGMNDGLNSADALRVQNVVVDPVDSRNLYIGTDAGAYALTLTNLGRVARVIEYYAPQFDDYFITPVIDEIQVLDTQVIPGWYRTGHSFEAYIQPTPGADPLCRFYVPPASHFFSGLSAECAAVLEFNVPPFVYESSNSFYLPAPDMTTGACPAGLIPVYRLYNNKPMLTNHRYTTDVAIRAQMVDKGYIAEGYGPDKVMMCSPN